MFPLLQREIFSRRSNCLVELCKTGHVPSLPQTVPPHTAYPSPAGCFASFISISPHCAVRPLPSLAKTKCSSYNLVLFHDLVIALLSFSPSGFSVSRSLSNMWGRVVRRLVRLCFVPGQPLRDDLGPLLETTSLAEACGNLGDLGSWDAFTSALSR